MAHTPANSTTTNPIVLEVFTADVAISATPITIKNITFVSAAAGDDFALKTKSAIEDEGIIGIHLAQNISGGMVGINYGREGHKFPSLYFDYDDVNSGLGAGDRVCIYLK